MIKVHSNVASLGCSMSITHSTVHEYSISFFYLKDRRPHQMLFCASGSSIHKKSAILKWPGWGLTGLTLNTPAHKWWLLIVKMSPFYCPRKSRQDLRELCSTLYLFCNCHTGKQKLFIQKVSCAQVGQILPLVAAKMWEGTQRYK